MKDYGIGLNFETESFTYVKEDQTVERPFYRPQNLENKGRLEDLSVDVPTLSWNLKLTQSQGNMCDQYEQNGNKSKDREGENINLKLHICQIIEVSESR
jgi:hypothetical protein